MRKASNSIRARESASPAFRVAALACAVILFSVLLPVACGTSNPRDPFERDQGDAAAAGAAGAPGDAGLIDVAVPDVGNSEDPELGGPCLDDGQCDDELDCTTDICDSELGRCRHQPDHSKCQNDIFCDGQEVCDPKDGCRQGEVVACSDDDTCTIDECEEETQSCDHRPRDADGDGDAPWNCAGGGDCLDTDPFINSMVEEVCDNDLDDDCDGEVDEDDCAEASYDRCNRPLEIEETSQVVLSLTAAKRDYAASCLEEVAYRDVVMAVVVPEGDPVDVDVVARAANGRLVLAAQSECGDASSETGCARELPDRNGEPAARLRLRGLEPGAYPIVLFADREIEATVSVRYLEPEDPPENETCGTAQPLSFGEHVTATVFDAETDLDSACDRETGELSYRLDLQEPSDLTIRATALDDLGTPSLSLRDADCVAPESELGCGFGNPSQLFKRALAAGEYTLAVSATGYTEVDLVAELSEASDAPQGDSCDDPRPLNPGETYELEFSGYEDTVSSACLLGAVDIVHSLVLEEPSDVLLLQRTSDSDEGGVALLKPACEGDSDRLACASFGEAPSRLNLTNLASGEYRIVSETRLGNPATLTAFVRPQVEPTLVAFSSTCEDALQIPETGGRFVGNTAQATADYSAGCDQASLGAQGAPEQILYLNLTERRRVVFDMQDSDYDTLLNVRRGTECPGDEILRGCVPGYMDEKSFVDLTLPEGDYFIQVDGYGGDRGEWTLDIYTGEP